MQSLFSRPKQTTKMLLVAVMVFVLALPTLSAVIGDNTAKAADNPDLIAEKVFSFQAYALMTDSKGDGCLWKENFGLTADPGSWMDDSLRNGENVPSGTAFNEFAGIKVDSGDINCFGDDGKAWITKALSIWEYTQPDAFLAAIAKQCDNQCMELRDDGKYVIRNGRDGVNAAVKALLTKAGAYYAGSSLNGLSQAELYYDALRNFQVQCDATFTQSGVATSDTDRVTSQTKAYNESGEVVTGYWHFDPHLDEDIRVGTALDMGASTKCTDLSKVLTDNAKFAAFQTYVQANGLPGGATSNQPTGGSTTDTGGCTAIVNPLTWLLCPIIDLADGLYGFLTEQIQSLLNLDENEYKNSDLEKSWAIFRNIASTLLVLVALFMIVSQVFSFEFMSAYTVKKVLPRLVIAAILIQLSWFIFTTMITIVNDIGVGIYSLLLAPFNLNSTGGDIIDMLGSSSEGQKLFAGTLALVVGAGGFVAVGGLAGIVGLAIVGIFGIFAALATLILRKILIIILLVVAPLALVAWILPGTQKWWESWWKLFSRLLLMFPLIMALIAGGRIAANIFKSQDAGGVATPLIVVIAYFLPLFLIPATFKFAGGIFANTSAKLSGMSGKWGKQAGGLAKSKTSGYAASKYKPTESKGFRNKMRNFGARASTGNVLPTRRSAMLTAAAGTKYNKERNEEADFLAENSYAEKGYSKGGDYLIEKAKENTREGKAALRLIAETKRFDLLDKVGADKVKAYANENRAFGAAVGGNRKDLLDPGKVPIWTAADAIAQHDSFWGSIDSNGVYTEGDNTASLNQNTINTIRGNKDLYDRLTPAAKEFIDSRGGATYTNPSSAGSGGGGPSPTPPSSGGGTPPVPPSSGGGTGTPPTPPNSGGGAPGGGGPSPTPPSSGGGTPPVPPSSGRGPGTPPTAPPPPSQTSNPTGTP